MLLPLVDGGIMQVHSDKESYGGCETCDYGSSYINEFNIKMTQGTIRIKMSAMYEYVLSEGYMMETLLHHVDAIRAFTENEFYTWLKLKLEKDFGDKIKTLSFS
jgi:hypothetical protein